MLLITSGLLIRAVWRVQAIDPGFVPRQVLTLRTALPRPRYDNPVRRGAFYDRVLTDVRALPGVQSAAFISGLPMVVTGLDHRRRDPRSGRAERPQRRREPSLGDAAVFQDHGHSPAARTRRRGRRHRRPGLGRRGQRVVRRALLARSGSDRQDVRPPRSNADRRRRGRRRQGARVGADQRAADLPARTADSRGASRQVRPEGSRDSAFRSATTRWSPPSARSSARPIPSSRSPTCARWTTCSRAIRRRGAPSSRCWVCWRPLPSCSPASASTACWPTRSSQRSQEIGVRLALGAEPAQVGRMIFADGMRLALFGIVPGVLGAYAAARGMSALLFGIAPGDPATFAAAVGVALVMTFAGSAGAGAEGGARHADVGAESGVNCLSEPLRCGARQPWPPPRGSSPAGARRCRRRTSPTSGASERSVRTRHGASRSRAEAPSASRRPG